MAKTRLAGIVEIANRDGLRSPYFVLVVPHPNEVDANATTRVRIPVGEDVYEEYHRIIREHQRSDSGRYVAFSGEIEFRVEEIPP